MELLLYEDKYQERWDSFVMNKSINGTFLQTRNFLNYHPRQRFKNASLLVMQGSNILAVIPACCVEEEGKRCFYSHKGSTFGGIIVDRHSYNIATIEEIFSILEMFLKENSYDCAYFKNTSDIFCRCNTDLLEYFFYKNGFSLYDELSFYVDLDVNDLLMNMDKNKRRDYRYSLRNALSLRQLETDQEVEDFYHILCKNLKKYNTIPVHSLSELIEFKNSRLTETVGFYGVYLQERLVAGCMAFYFEKKVFHTQYLAQDPDFAHLYLMNFLDFELIRLAKEKGFEKFSFGISTENRGRILNKGLALFKEGFGCRYCVNRSFLKMLKM